MPAGAHGGVAKLTRRAAFHRTAKLCRHGLHAVADTQHRHTKLEDNLRRIPFLAGVHRIRPAGKDDAARVELANELFAHVERMQFAIHLLLTHAAGNQLRNLRTEIEDENFLMHK